MFLLQKTKKPPHINFKSEQGAAACPHQSNEDEYFKIDDAFFALSIFKKIKNKLEFL